MQAATIDAETLDRLAEQDRLDALADFDARGLADDRRLTAITAFAARLCDTPTALVSLVEAERQWFPGRHGLDVAETPRATSFCAHAMREDDIMIVPDARDDPRFGDNPLVTGDPGIRFYAGAPLRSAEGAALGALCVIDYVPRAGLTDLQRQGLRVLADDVMTILGLRRTTLRSHRSHAEQEERFRILADSMPQMVWSTRPDGFHDYYNARWYEYTGMPPGSTDGEAWNGMFHPDDQDRAWTQWRHSLATGDPYEIEYRLRDATGDYRWTLGRALPMRDPDGCIVRWFGTCTDIHDHKQMQEQREIISHELSHRIKNIFSVIGGLVTFATHHHPGIKDIAADLRERIMALGRAHDFVRPHSERSRPIQAQNSLRGLLDELLLPYRVNGRSRMTFEGVDPDVDDRSATPMALLYHELATNAAKYGAFSTQDGQVRIVVAEQDGMVAIDWIEQGGPTVTEPPARSGFGSQLIELSAIRQLGGTIAQDWRPDGLRFTLRVPTRALARAV